MRFFLTASSLLVSICIGAVCVATATAAEPRYATQEIEGWTVHVDLQLLDAQKLQTQQALDLMRQQLRFITETVPAKHLPALRKVPLWISPQYKGVGARAEYHPSKKWLEENGRNPEMARGIEFTNVSIFEAEVRRMPVFVLHELAHAYHDQVLGFDQQAIRKQYERTRDSGSYDMVERHNGKIEKAYAMTDHKEYFAESTEAFFGQNDFFPFNSQELKRHDPGMYALLEQIWGRR